MTTLEDIVAHAVHLGLVKSEDVIGLPEHEIQVLERLAGVPLPAAYRHFLALMGRGMGPLSAGDWVTIFLRNASDYQWTSDFATYPVRDENGERICERGQAFIFCWADDNQVRFFKLGAGDDPPVFAYAEYDERAHIAGASLSGYLCTLFEEEVQSLLRGVTQGRHGPNQP